MKIGILLPPSFDTAMLWRVRQLCRILRFAPSLNGGAVELAIGLPERPEREWRAHEQWLRDDMQDIIVRHLRWERVSSGNAGRMFAKHGLQLDLSDMREVLIPRDWGWNFTDCDAWINIADPGLGAVLPLKPTAHYVSDLAVRIVPEAVSEDLDDPYWENQTDAFRLWRQESIVAVSDQWTADDVIGYAGVRRSGIMQVPSLSQPGETPTFSMRPRDPDLWVWLMEANARHDMRTALEGLKIYVSEGGKRRPVIACQNAAALDPFNNERLLGWLDETSQELLAELEIIQYPDYRTLSRLLSRAGLVWSSEIAGGESFALSHSLHHGASFLGVDFPIHRLCAEAQSDAVLLYKENDPLALADAFHQMESLVAASPVEFRPEQSAAMQQQRYGFLIDRLLERVRD